MPGTVTIHRLSRGSAFQMRSSVGVMFGSSSASIGGVDDGLGVPVVRGQVGAHEVGQRLDEGQRVTGVAGAVGGALKVPTRAVGAAAGARIHCFSSMKLKVPPRSETNIPQTSEP